MAGSRPAMSMVGRVAPRPGPDHRPAAGVGRPAPAPSPGARRSCSLLADVFVPHGGVRSNELRHQLLAPRILKDFDGHSPAAKQLLLAPERAVFSDHDAL